MAGSCFIRNLLETYLSSVFGGCLFIQRSIARGERDRSEMGVSIQEGVEDNGRGSGESTGVMQRVEVVKVYLRNHDYVFYAGHIRSDATSDLTLGEGC